ncbi:aspartic proteinase PCS1-like, partial [Capsicum annuum]|uniref:aspartic proteinase PCS1-like n=1 Tax=Capsicum annuum TaxID=4072 RepID=UPI001FB11695
PLLFQNNISFHKKLCPSILHSHQLNSTTLTVSLSAGSPPQQVTMVLDTGSELTWIRCKKTPNTPLIFDPLVSKSYSLIPCSSATCTTKTRDFPNPVICDPKKLCHATLTYADGFSIEGNLASETFSLNNVNLPRTVFGCMDGSSGSTPEDAKTTGLIGMNRGALSFVSQSGYPTFSYCISGQDSNGVLVFGEANSPGLKPRKYTPLVQISIPLPSFDRVAYTVQMSLPPVTLVFPGVEMSFTAEKLLYKVVGETRGRIKYIVLQWEIQIS